MTSGVPPSNPLRLELRQITRRFGRVLALDGATFALRAGTIHALLGENGAGKTTLMRIAYGLMRADAGQVLVDGAARRLRSSADAIRYGLGMVHQHYALVPAMTVAENVALGGRGRFEVHATAERVRTLAAATGLALDPLARVADLSVEAQQRVEIIKALAHEARILILDEPTAVLAPATAAGLLVWLRRWVADGRAVVLITHKLREALGVADDITVLRHGRTVLAAAAASTSEGELARAMLGASTAGASLEAGGGQRQRPPGAGAPVIRAVHVTIADARGVTRITDASFTVAPGEIVGVAAVDGQGQQELLRAVAGRHPVASGQLVAPVDLGFIPEDRQRDGLISEFALYENLALRDAGTRRGRMRWRRLRDRTRALLTAYDVRAAGPDVPARTLSGGNQQKLVLARELDGPDERPTVGLVAVNPTRGLDIQATGAMHDRLRAARDAGLAIILHSADIDEVLALADRVLVVARGTVREVPRERETVGRAMLGL